MNSAQQGGPAFPCKVQWDGAGGITGAQTGQTTGWDTGMSLRDYFAAKAMQSMTSGEGALMVAERDKRYDETNWAEIVASNAYQIADAMLAMREKGGAE